MRIRLGATTVLAATAGFVGVLLIVASAPVWRNAAPTWRLTVPGIPHPPQSSLHAALWFFGGLLLMWVGWLALFRDRRLAVVLVVIGIWAIPPLLSTPLLSNDAYAYAAQGAMAADGIDPTAEGAYSLHRGPFLNAVDPIWRDSPAPYGPVAVQLSAWAVDATGHDPAAAVWSMRAYAFAGVVMTAVGVVLLARQHEVAVAPAVTAGVGGPLVLLHMIGGSHNDALMMGLLALGMAAFGAHRRVLSVVMVIIAAAVKLPAAVALAFIGWNWRAAPGTGFWSRVTSTGVVGAVAVSVLVAQTLAVGIGTGWITALSDTGTVTTTFSMSTKLGFLAHDIAGLVGFEVGEDTMIAASRLVGLAVAAGICAWLLWRSPQIGVTRSVGMALVVTVLLGPVVWPWYLPAGLALLAASGLGRFTPSYVVLTLAASLFVWPSSVDPVHSLQDRGHLLGLGFLSLVAIAAWAAQLLTPRVAAWAEQRRPGGSPDRPPGSLDELDGAQHASVGVN